MGLTKRKIGILEKIVKEYVRTARPVPSRLLSEKYDFEVCSATIRNEMCDLVEKEYLQKPHASAGRVPTDRAYRFFVERLRKRNGFEAEAVKVVTGKEGDLWARMGDLTEFLARTSSLFALTGFPEKGLFFEGGWEEVLMMPEFEKRERALGFARLIKKFKKTLSSSSKKEKRIRVYIGSETPLNGEGFEEFSIIVTRCRLNGDKKGVLSMVGPKRMPYGKNIGLMERIKNSLESL